MSFGWKPGGTDKKDEEQAGLEYFLQAYEWSLGEKLTILESHEQPDFICSRPSGHKVGIELTAGRRDPRDEQSQRILSKQYEMDSEEAFEWVQIAISEKDEKRNKHYDTWVHNTILVVQLFECSLSSLTPYFRTDIKFNKDFGPPSIRDELQKVGFTEVWLADYTLIPPFGVVELFGLKPLELWGHYPRPDHLGKPYG